ncbi:MAG TPA: lactoylglutathione lyase, partial [Halieaceae bacterium]|nr:lactoylglutathione lyase [Halieaceae bacterium]
MKYLHTMVRVRDLDESLDFYCNKLGLAEVHRMESEQGRFTLVYLAAPGDVEAAKAGQSPLLELTWNWDPEEYSGGRNFGHLAYRVEDIYALCESLR